MEQFIIEGGHPLSGTVEPAGNKNAAQAVLAATLLTDEPITLKNLPRIGDIACILEIMRELGVSVQEIGPGTGASDDSRIGFYFHPLGTEIEHTVTWGGVSNGSFEIPPRHPNWLVGAARVFEKDTILFSLHPHMHYRGKDMKYTATYPDGSKELLLDVEDYDYGWQTNYIYRRPKLLPAGTLIEVIAALVIFSMGVLVVMNLATVLSYQMQVSAVRSTVVVKAREELDALLAEPYASLSPGTTVDTTILLGRDFVTTTTIIQLQPRLLELSVSVGPARPPGPTVSATGYVHDDWNES